MRETRVSKVDVIEALNFIVHFHGVAQNFNQLLDALLCLEWNLIKLVKSNTQKRIFLAHTTAGVMLSFDPYITYTSAVTVDKLYIGGASWPLYTSRFRSCP